MCSRPSRHRRFSTIFRISAINVFERGTSSESTVQNDGDRFAMLRRLSDDIDRIFENFGTARSFFPSDLWQGGVVGRESSIATWSPRIEMVEKDGKLRISADLPGVKKEDLDVHVDQDAVTI